MPRRRWIVALAVLAALLVAAEVTIRRWESPKACVQIINDCDGILEDLVVVYAETRMPVGRILKNQSAHTWLTAGPLGTLRLEYRQKGNAIQGFQIPDFDPGRLIQDSSKLVLVVGTNQIQRYVEEDDTRRDKESLGEMIRRWLRSELDPPP
jgi:hypothetical protein